MDILHLVDRVEEVLKGSVRLPFTPIRWVDERKIGPLLEQMRISVPEEVRRAQRVIQERDQLLSEARQKAETLVRQAEQRVGELAGDHTVARAAEARAAAIREKAEREAQAMRADATEYAFNTLCQLEEELRRTLRVVENGLRKIQAERAAAEEEAQTGRP